MRRRRKSWLRLRSPPAWASSMIRMFIVAGGRLRWLLLRFQPLAKINLPLGRQRRRIVGKDMGVLNHEILRGEIWAWKGFADTLVRT